MRSLHFSDSWLGVGNFLIDYSIPDRPILAHANLSSKLNDETPKRRILFFFSSNKFLLSLYSCIQPLSKVPLKQRLYLFGYMFSSNLNHDTIRKVKVCVFSSLIKTKTPLGVYNYQQSHVLFLTWSHSYISFNF